MGALHMLAPASHHFIYIQGLTISLQLQRVTAILSDYDGTLCPVASSRTTNKIPKDLEEILWNISDRIPICVLSSKDFIFLHEKARFASLLSCVFGIETIVHDTGIHKSNSMDCIKSRRVIVNRQSLSDISKLLSNVVNILQGYEDLRIEEKYTSDKEIMIGLTIDYRHLKNWSSFKEDKEPMIREAIQSSINADMKLNSSPHDRPFLQTYSSHPFLDLYGVQCDKGLAFDNVVLGLGKEESANVMYLGDSENDNPAFRKSHISVGIRSDTRVNPSLDCKYMLDFDQLSSFLGGLMDNDLAFSEELLLNKTI